MLRKPSRSAAFFAVLSTFAVLALLFGPPRTASVKPDEVAFVARAGGAPAEGTVRDYKTEFQFDPNAPEQASLRLVFDMRSTSTGSSMADRAAFAEEFLHVERFPSAELTALGAKPAGEGKYIMQGNLTLKGVTKAVTLPLSIAIKDGVAALRGETSVNRLDFGIGPESYMGLILDREVKIRFALSGLKLNDNSADAEKSVSGQPKTN